MNISEMIRKQIESGGERFWRFVDFKNFPLTAVAKALSRLSLTGMIKRIGKGLYYKPRQTVFGQSKPNNSQLWDLLPDRKACFPVGISAANLLGFSTQNTAKIEVATNASSLPRLLVGKATIVHARRPDSWLKLSNEEAALLDFLRQRGKYSELTPQKTTRKLIERCCEHGIFEKLVQAAETEPPRVRAMLGAIGQEIGCSEESLQTLRKSLNPLSRFDFGHLMALKYAKDWQAVSG